MIETSCVTQITEEYRYKRKNEILKKKKDSELNCNEKNNLQFPKIFFSFGIKPKDPSFD